jgi:hypothetical protein
MHDRLLQISAHLFVHFLAVYPTFWRTEWHSVVIQNDFQIIFQTFFQLFELYFTHLAAYSAGC